MSVPIYEIDLAEIEKRAATHFCSDRIDQHDKVAKEMFGESFTPEHRAIAKRRNYFGAYSSRIMW